MCVAHVLQDGEGRQLALIQHVVSFFSTKFFLVNGARAVALALPAKGGPETMLAGQLIARVSEPWTSGGVTVPAGAIVAIDAAALRRTPDKLVPVVIRAPGARESIGTVNATKAALFVEINQNVRGRVAKFTRAANGSWSSTMLSLPDNATTQRRWHAVARQQCAHQRHQFSDADEPVAGRRDVGNGERDEVAPGSLRCVAR